MTYKGFSVPRTGLEPARLAALAPETSASTIPPPGLLRCKVTMFIWILQFFLDVFLWLCVILGLFGALSEDYGA